MNNMDIKEFVEQVRQMPAEQAVDVLCALVIKQDEMIKALEAKFTAIIAEQAAEIAALKKLVYGQRSEKRKPKDEEDPPESASLTPPNQPNRGKASTQRNGNHQTDKGLRFTGAAEKMVIEIPVPAGENVEIIRYETIHRLAQRPAAVIVLEYRIPIIKNRKSNQL